MKAYVSIVEVYPVFQLTKKSAETSEIDVSKEKLNQMKAVFKEFSKLQKQLKKLIDPVPLDPVSRKKGKL